MVKADQKPLFAGFARSVSCIASGLAFNFHGGVPSLALDGLRLPRSRRLKARFLFGFVPRFFLGCPRDGPVGQAFLAGLAQGFTGSPALGHCRIVNGWAGLEFLQQSLLGVRRCRQSLVEILLEALHVVPLSLRCGGDIGR
jgi:hypothetical protein